MRYWISLASLGAQKALKSTEWPRTTDGRIILGQGEVIKGHIE